MGDISFLVAQAGPTIPWWLIPGVPLAAAGVGIAIGFCLIALGSRPFKLAGGLIVLVIALFVIAFAVALYTGSSRASKDAERAWAKHDRTWGRRETDWHVGDKGPQTMVAYLVVEYLRTYKNNWPPDWDALEPTFNGAYRKNSLWTFDELKNEVLLEFQIDGPSLLEVARNPEKSLEFNAIQSKSVAREHFKTDPNQIILDHFRDTVSH